MTPLTKDNNKLGETVLLWKNKAAANRRFAIGGVSSSADSFVVTESFVLRINIRGEKPAHRKSAKRFESA